jgi:L-iditol 2-dehydrogenase
MRDSLGSSREKLMTAAVLYGKRDVRIEQIPVPRVEPGEVLVRIKAALTCGTDLKVYLQGSHARMIVPPSVFGHELSGIVEEVGSQVTGFAPGMRVVSANSAPCTHCFFCRKGQLNLCEDLQFLNGAYAEFIKIPERIVRQNLLVLPDDMDFKEAAMVEPLACVLRGVEATGAGAGDTAVVIGTGPIGLMFVQLFKNIGARVIATSNRPNQLELATEMGADHVINATDVNLVEKVRDYTTGRRGADVVIEAVGMRETWQRAIGMVRRGGTINLFGGCPAGTQIPLDSTLFHYSELTIKATFHHTPHHIRKALETIRSGKVRPSSLITGQENLASLRDVLERLLLRNGDLKIAITP